ncbi:MAG: prepilin-type N-terminal cleavage/methylation domain-containing protein, partial [Candidatus Pacebacteria bacterium]|nr:prepilin-type N-terminal cleavage/methylation domain-containing protein [Candidatus Paceibacterota bacterium]
MKKLGLKKGFTLIELLVVIAILGILASIVLASL